MILSQACDCLSKPYICLARVIDLQEFDLDYANRLRNGAGTRNIADYIQNKYQRAGAKPDAFYLQENANLQLARSAVAFTQLHSIETSTDNIDYLKNQRLTRLESQAVLDLQFRLAFYFGRFATEDNYMLTQAEKESLQTPTQPISRSSPS